VTNNPLSAFSTFTADDTTNVITLPSTNINLLPYTPVQVSTTTTLPTPLVASTNYFTIKVTDTTFKLASSYDAAVVGAAIDINTTGTGTHTLNTLLPRYTNGAGVQAIFLNSNATPLGAGTPNLSASYTNSQGVSGRTTPLVLPIGKTAASNSLILYSGTGAGKYGPSMPLMGGDGGIRSIQTIGHSTSYVSGEYSVVLYKPLATFPMTTIGVASERDFMNQVPSLPRISHGYSILEPTRHKIVHFLDILILHTDNMVKIYSLIDDRFPDVFRYVGKTSKTLAHRLYHHRYRLAADSNLHKARWIMRVEEAGGKVLAILLEECDDVIHSEREIYWISRLRADGHPLTNMTDGGEGGVPSVEVREKISTALRGRKRPPHVVEALRKNGKRYVGAANPNFGKTHTPEAINRIIAGRVGVPLTLEHRIKLSEQGGRTKLTRDQVIEIFRRVSSEGQSRVSVARYFGVSTKAVSHIVCGTRWKHLNLKG
jgi:hypothetical protein